MPSRIFLLLAICSLAYVGCREPVEPINIGTIADQVESIMVYNVSGRYGDKYTEQEIQEALQEPFDICVFRELSPHAKFVRITPVGKGTHFGQLAIVNLRYGTQAKVVLSVPGHFFRIVGQDGFYVFDRKEDKRKYRKELYGRIIGKAFKLERKQDQETLLQVYQPVEEEEIQGQMKAADEHGKQQARNN